MQQPPAPYGVPSPWVTNYSTMPAYGVPAGISGTQWAPQSVHVNPDSLSSLPTGTPAVNFYSLSSHSLGNSGFLPPSTSPSRRVQRSSSVCSSPSPSGTPPSSRAQSVTMADDPTKVRVEWDRWPDGDIEKLFSWDEFHAADELAVNWACEPLGGDKRGSDTADEWQNGKKAGRRCRGIIRCKNLVCSIIVRPQTRQRSIQKQLRERCRGNHDHARPTHILHLTAGQRDKFRKIVEEHPTVGPLALLVGRPGIEGPQESVAEISSVLLNKDRIKAERRIVKRQGNGPTSDIAAFAQFEKDSPGFVIFSQFGEVTIIVMQTPFMLAQLFKTQVIRRDAINGIVSDGAHGYFIEHAALLLMSSAYCLDLDCWVPGIMSYTNGATQEHFCLHFLAMFESMASYAEKQGTKITDKAFKNVVDFSDAERVGFVEAFVIFWKRRKDDVRTEEELRKAAGGLLKGCQQHFRAQVNRIKNISAVVHPSLRDAFANDALALLDVDDYAEFLELVDHLIKKFPKTENWVGWWAREDHAKMLFKPFRQMAVQEWHSMPSTTNSQESQHKKIYVAIGKKHPLIPGLKGLRRLAEHYALLASAVSSGVAIRYGMAEAWKYTKARDGLSKRSRAMRRSSRRDGRPPDTSKELVGRGHKGRISASKGQTSTPAKRPSTAVAPLRPGYPWHKNSCYLDTSLELIFQTVSRDFHRHFGARASDLHEAESLSQLYEHMALRRAVEDDPSGGTSPVVLQTLATQRESFRTFIKRARMGWLESIISHQADPAHSFPRSYFQAHSILLRTCPGDEQTPRHLHLKQIKPQCYFNLTTELFEIYGGDVEKWFRNLVMINRTPANGTCWRNVDDDGAPTFSGAARELSLLLGIPAMLILEMPSAWGTNVAKQWNFPRHIRPLTQGAESLHGVVYDIVGRAFSNGSHFKATYTPDDKHVYAYNDLRNDGCSVLNADARIDSHLAGKIMPKSGWRTYAVIYRLRGGTRAQSFFTKYQVAASERLHSIRFSPPATNAPYLVPDVNGFDLPDIMEVDCQDRFWLKRPWRTDMPDFILSQPPKRAAKRVHFAAIDGEDEADVSDSPPPRKRRRRDDVVLSDDEFEPEAKSSGAIAESNATAPDAETSDDNEIEFSCRCGDSSRGISGSKQLIKCTICKVKSHLACQRNGRAPQPKAEKSFRCDNCLPPSHAFGMNRNTPKTRKKNFFRPGKDALARFGKFWYPVRLISKDGTNWEVKWWRGNKYEMACAPPNKVSIEDLRDELWADASGRRQIREDLVLEFRDFPYTEEISAALQPHLAVLEKLNTEDESNHPAVPAVKYSRSQKKGKAGKPGAEVLRNGGIPYTGELQSIDCARVSNWFYHSVPGAKESVVNWMGRVPLAHAYTILISVTPEYTAMDRQEAIFDIAWKRQRKPSVRFIDVDHECLGYFEERLFENSLQAGRAGNQQWGLAKGPHQDNWGPYMNLPTHWNHDDREDEIESELQRGPHYTSDIEADLPPDTSLRPKRTVKPTRKTPRTLTREPNSGQDQTQE
ncbi:hypothetical protein DFH09DRAFT_1114122 [Mycena vulgaris]|nr:hypothetical protein DFH09DRAFT_1114122 [Mycena vulgaris]